MLDRDLAELYGEETKRMRSIISSNKNILLKLEQLEKKMFNQEGRIRKHEYEVQVIFETLKKLINQPQGRMARIGFRRRDEEQ